MKRQYDVTFTIEMGEKAWRKLNRASDEAEERDEDLPLWLLGLDFCEWLRDMCGVKARLVQWSLGRNPADVRREFGKE